MTTELTNAVTALNDVTQKHEQLNEKYQGTHDALANNTQAMTDWQTQQGTVELTDQHGNKHPTPTLKTLVEQAQSVNPHPHAMTKAQFDALRDMRKHQYAGSGFVEWGKHRGHGNSYAEIIGEGFWARTRSDANNSLKLGYRAISDHGFRGTSRTIEPLVLVDGTFLKISSTPTNSSSTIDGTTDIDLPQAPDGTKTYDSATGTVTQHTNAEVAFASETATNKVITSRKDLVFLESWHEKIADKDVVYPLGNVQYGASSYEGVTLLNNLVAQGYSAFGEWDENTKGYGAKWSSLTDAQKALFLSEPEQNIYFDPQANAYIQVRYRIRVVEGKSNDWDERTINGASASGAIFGLNYGLNVNRIAVRGQIVSHIDWAVDGNNFFHNQTWIHATTNSEVDYDRTLWRQRSGGADVAFNNSARAIPIALVQRMNQGAYHPVYNPMGTAYIWNGSTTVTWFNQHYKINSKLQAFTNVPHSSAGDGSIASASGSRSDQYKYYDAIYAGQVEDLRLNSNKLDVNKLREDAMRKAIAGTLRGKGKVPFTLFGVAASDGNNAMLKIHGNHRYSTYLDAKTAQVLNLLPNSHISIIANALQHVRIYDLDAKEDLTAIAWKYGTSIYLGGTGKEGNRIMVSLVGFDDKSPEFDSLPWVDIIGDPERIAATFPDGVVGQWVPVIPSNSRPDPLNRKSTTSTAFTLRTVDDGNTWSALSMPVDQVTNESGHWSQTGQVALYHYETSSNFTEPSTNSVVVGDVGNVWAGNDARVEFGNRLQGSLSNGVGTTVAYTSNRYAPLDGYTLRSNGSALMPDEYPSHTCLPSLGGGDGNMGVKALSTITEKNGLYYLQLHGVELKHAPITQADMTVITAGIATGPITKGKVYLFKGYDNALINRPIIAIADHMSITWHKHDFDGYTINSIGQVIDRGNINPLLRAFESHWGDDQTIPIVDGKDVKTDLNGNTVKVFCHHTQIPLGIAHID